MATVRHARGTRAALDALASGGLLVPWQLYALSDENRVAIATSTSTYQAFAKEGEGGGALLATNNLSDVANAATARTNLGLGNVDNTSDSSKPISSATQAALDAKQPLDATLTAFAGLTIAANSLSIGAGVDAFAQTSFAANTFPARASTGDLVAKPITDFALTLLDDVDAAAMRTTLGITSGASLGANTFAATQTITPAANTNALAVTGYSLTGSNAQAMFDLSGTWNTSGTPTAIKVNITNTASNAASNLLDLQVGGITQMRVQRDGSMYFGSGINRQFDFSSGFNFKYFGGSIFTAGNGDFRLHDATVLRLNRAPIQDNAPSTVASAATIVLNELVTKVSGSAAIDTITVTSSISGGSSAATVLHVIPTGAFTWTTAGNIATAGTAVVSRLLSFAYVKADAKWYPSYT